jgi:prevent-host-death family protein
MKFTEARPHLSELLNRVFGKEVRIRITRGNIPVAAIVSVEDLDRLNQLDAQRDADFEIFHKISAAFADQTPEQIEEQVELAVARVRDEIRRERQPDTAQ